MGANQSYVNGKNNCSSSIPFGDTPGPLTNHGSYQMYQTHFGNKRPFRVFVDITRKVAIITGTSPTEGQGKLNVCYSHLVNQMFRFEKVFIGQSAHKPNHPEFDGNSILFLVSKKEHRNHTFTYNYLYVGGSIFSFHTKSAIKKFHSDVNTTNDIPFPYAVDEHNDHYFLLERVRVAGKHFHRRREHPVEIFYGEQLPGVEMTVDEHVPYVPKQ
jgi:hypothetical protein